MYIFGFVLRLLGWLDAIDKWYTPNIGESSPENHHQHCSIMHKVDFLFITAEHLSAATTMVTFE